MSLLVLIECFSNLLTVKKCNAALSLSSLTDAQRTLATNTRNTAL